MTKPNLTFPPLSLTFRSGGYINIIPFRSGGYINTIPFGEEKGVVVPFRALTINVIMEDKEEVRNRGVHSVGSIKTEPN